MTPIPSTPEASQDALFAEIDSLARAWRQAHEQVNGQIENARTTPLPGVTPISARAAYVSSANLMKHGWSVKTYLPEVQVDGLLSAMRAGRKAEVQELADWLDKDDGGLSITGRTLPLEMHPDIARAVATPVRAWLKLQDAVAVMGADHQDASPAPSRYRRLGR